MTIEQTFEKLIGKLITRLTTTHCVAVTMSDTADLPHEGYVLFLLAADTGKTLKVTTASDEIVSIVLATNEILPILVKKVWSTGSTAGATPYVIY